MQGVPGEVLIACPFPDPQPQATIESNIFFIPGSNPFDASCDVLALASSNIVADPLFVDPGNGDWRLRPDSPGVDAGDAERTLPSDLDGNERPCGAGVDLGAFERECVDAPLFRRGDANADARIDIADPVWILSELFAKGPATRCRSAADANDDGDVDLSDAMVLLSYAFFGGRSPPEPVAGCGPDPTGDMLGCGEYAPCEGVQG